MNKNNKANYISLQEATKYCDYSQEYLSLRARQGKLKAVKIGRNWLTKKEWLKEYLRSVDEEANYISLQEATKYCNYSQEYLSLRARQRKLKAVKLGRNWVTKKEWMEEYLGIFGEKKVERITEPKIVGPPENLPVETSTIKLSIKQPIPKIRFGFAVALISVLLIGGIFLFWQVQPEISFEDTAMIIVVMGSKEVRTSTMDTFKDYGLWLKSQIPKIKTGYFATDDFVKKKLVQGYQIITRPFIKVYQLVVSPPEEPEILETTEEGMVVVPSTEEDEEMKRKIKEAFSDEVRVEPKDETSGIIIPIFREREGQEYLYIMVPMKN